MVTYGAARRIDFLSSLDVFWFDRAKLNVSTWAHQVYFVNSSNDENDNVITMTLERTSGFPTSIEFSMAEATG